MSIEPNGPHAGTPEFEDIVSITRRGVSARLSDPYLTDHDRWVLQQFRRFLGGIAPEPDPRVSPAGAGRNPRPR